MSEKAKRQPTLKVYISVIDGLRVVVEKDCLTIEEKIGKEENDNWGVVGYYTSWDSIISALIKRRGFKQLVGKKDEFTFKEAQKEYLEAIEEIKFAMLGKLEDKLKDGTDDIKNIIKKYCF